MGLRQHMSDPVTTTVAASAATSAGYKVLTYIFGASMAAIVVMFMSQPISKREWFCALVSTVFCSITIGAYLVGYHGIGRDVAWEYQAQLIGGIYFLCGLPGWFLVRAIFFTLSKYNNKTVFEVVEEFRKDKHHMDESAKRKGEAANEDKGPQNP